MAAIRVLITFAIIGVSLVSSIPLKAVETQPLNGGFVIQGFESHLEKTRENSQMREGRQFGGSNSNANAQAFAASNSNSFGSPFNSGFGYGPSFSQAAAQAQAFSNSGSSNLGYGK